MYQFSDKENDQTWPNARVPAISFFEVLGINRKTLYYGGGDGVEIGLSHLHAKACQALKELLFIHIFYSKVIFCSSKTEAEVVMLRLLRTPLVS
jgi:hypothetical protein